MVRPTPREGLEHVHHGPFSLSTGHLAVGKLGSFLVFCHGTHTTPRCSSAG